MNSLSAFFYSLIYFPLVIQDIIKYWYFKKELHIIHEKIKQRLIELNIYSFKSNSSDITKVKELNNTPLLFHPEFEDLMIRHGRLDIKQKQTHFAVLLSLYEEKEEVKQFAFQSGLKITDSRKIVDLACSFSETELKEAKNFYNLELNYTDECLISKITVIDLIQSSYQKELKEWSDSGKRLITNMSSLILFLLFSICYYLSAGLMTYIFVYSLFLLICNKRGK